MGEGEKKILYCSFCGKSQHEVIKLIAGPVSLICDECVALCAEIIGNGSKFKPCSTCRYKFVVPETLRPSCQMFGNLALWTAREKYCGKYGDAWEPIELDHSAPTYSAISMAERVLG